MALVQIGTLSIILVILYIITKAYLYIAHIITHYIAVIVCILSDCAILIIQTDPVHPKTYAIPTLHSNWKHPI